MGVDVLLEFIGTLIIAIAKVVTMGHLNPAVTFWYYLTKKIDGVTALTYMVSQFTAAFVVFKLYN